MGALEKSVKGKTILITGASSGIGAALVQLFLDIDCTLILIARNLEKLQELELQSTKAQVHVFSCDLKNKREIENTIHFIHEHNLSVDIFVNNAGKSIQRNLLDSVDRHHDFERCMSVNYLGALQLLLPLIEHLQKNNGQLINVSAINVLLPTKFGWSAYQASKTAMDQWMRSNTPELIYNGIMVSTAYLPLVKTPMSEVNKNYKNHPAMSANDAAKHIAKLIYKKKLMTKPWWFPFAKAAGIVFPKTWMQMQMRELNR